MIEEIGGARLKKSDFIGINECFKPIEREYKRGEIITTYSPENDTICIIKEGTVYLTTDNAENQRRIISFYEKGDIIVTCIVPESDNRIFYLSAKTNCKIDFVKYSKFTACCEKHCSKHQRIISAYIKKSHKKKSCSHRHSLSADAEEQAFDFFLNTLKPKKEKTPFIFLSLFPTLQITFLLTEVQ